MAKIHCVYDAPLPVILILDKSCEFFIIVSYMSRSPEPLTTGLSLQCSSPAILNRIHHVSNGIFLLPGTQEENAEPVLLQPGYLQIC